MKLQDLLEAPAYSMQRFIQNIVNTDSEHLLRNMDMYKDGTMLIRVAYLRELIGRGLIDSPEIVAKLKAAGYIEDDLLIQTIVDSNPHLFLELMDVVTQTGDFLSNKVKLAAVKHMGMNLTLIPNPTPEMIKIGLTDEEFIMDYPDEYDRTVKHIFKNNTIMMNKWLRYAENVGNL
jgi:hypothetical protein